MELAEKEIQKFFVHTPLRFATSPLVVFKVLNDIIDSKEGFLIMDIGGETTEINLIRNNALEQSASFPTGNNLLFRKVVVALNTFLKEASSIVRGLCQSHRTLESSDKIAAAIKDSVGEWRDSLKSSLKRHGARKSASSKYFCNRRRSGLQIFFFWYFENSDFSEFTILRKPFVAQKINPEWLTLYFNPISSMTQSSQNFKKCETGDYQHKDIMLMIEAVYANKFLDFNF